MEDTNLDGSEVLETPETEPEAVEPSEELTAEQIAELKEKAAEAEELKAKNKQLFERAKKAEAEKAEAKKEEPTQSFTPKDLLALTEAKVTAEDFDEVQNFANYRKVSIADALKDKTLKTILAERADERRTAAATQTRSPRATSQATPDALLAKAAKGDLPMDDAGIQALADAEMAQRFKK